MSSTTTSTVRIENNEAQFVFPQSHETTTQVLFGLLEAADTGTITVHELIDRIQALTRDEPDHIDVHAHLGAILLENDRTDDAKTAYARAFDIGAALLSRGFEGTIAWSVLENRPFLRAAHGVVLTRLATGERAEAITLMEKMLAWNPNDNQGVRFMLGSEYLRHGKRTAARRILTAHAAEYPPYRYELGLLRIQKKEWTEAATSLRLGFIENPYIAEALCGSIEPMPLSIWHGSNYHEPGIALDYDDQFGPLWEDTPDALPFLRWLHTHPKVMMERAAILECRQELLWEHDFEARRLILDRERDAVDRIDDRLSAELVVDRMADGKRTRPWAHPRLPR
ncbi:MAG: hypothetical protein OXG04_01445 [Acidobacteria bacterium]|nr:hypothetical protein [Acidobacteriota bacterium]